jgi:hypothetical protein
MTAAHSKLGPSSMYRWEACPGSVRQSAGIKSISSAAADEGTLVHDLAARALSGEDPMTICESMPHLDAVQLWVDTVMGDYTARKRFDNTKPDHLEHLYVEQRFHLEALHPQFFGTSDAVVWEEVDRLLRVYDLKYGKTIVDVKDNTQLLYYALGASLVHNFPVREVECIIVQPRGKTKSRRVSRWRFSALDLMEFEDRLLRAARATEDPFAPLVPGSHCYFCPATFSCPAQLEAKREKAKQEFDDVPDEVSSVVVEKPVSDDDDIFA